MMSDRDEIRIPLSTLALLAVLGLLALGWAASPRDDRGRPLLLLPDVKAMEAYRRQALDATGELRLVDGEISAALSGDAGDLFGQTRSAQSAFEHILRVAEDVDRQAVPPALTGLHDELNAASLNYLESARLTLRWLSIPTPENLAAAREKLAGAQANLVELEKSQWLRKRSP